MTIPNSIRHYSIAPILMLTVTHWSAANVDLGRSEHRTVTGHWAPSASSSSSPVGTSPSS